MRIENARVVMAALALAGTAHADAAPTLLHAELDPLPFANQPGYGVQIGIRHPALRGVRVAIASFALDVPDFIAHTFYGDGIDQRVRPSGAIYGLYYFNAPGKDGFAVGASVRYLRTRYEHESDPSLTADIDEISPEVIVGYQWHPMNGRFYLQPWFALGVTVWRDRGTHLGSDPATSPIVLDPLPVSPFFTVNLGYEYSL
jgi:hypothetical protein